MSKTPLICAASVLAILAGCTQQKQPAPAKGPATSVSLGGRSYSVTLAPQTEQSRANRSMRVTTAPVLPTAATSTGAPETAELK